MNSRGGTESLSLQDDQWVAVGGCRSSFGWKQGGLEDALPYTLSDARELLENIFPMHSRSFFLPQQLPQKGKGRRVAKQVH